MTLHHALPIRRASGLPCLLALLALLAVPAAGAQGPAVTVLLYHPLDGVDPFGFPYGGADPFGSRYSALVADEGRFDFPFLVVDGVLVFEALPDPSRPFVGTLATYQNATAARLAEAAPTALHVTTRIAGAQATLAVATAPAQPLPDAPRLWVALAEDPVHFLPPPGLTNGVADHRFTLRSLADLGPVALDAPATREHAFALEPDWDRERLIVAAWLQQDAPSVRFDAREVVQATHVQLGGEVEQVGKGVLLEMLSATWCDPCLYGDLAVEQIAIERGAARPLQQATRPGYFDPAGLGAVPVLAALVVGGAFAWWGGRR